MIILFKDGPKNGETLEINNPPLEIRFPHIEELTFVHNLNWQDVELSLSKVDVYKASKDIREIYIFDGTY